MSSRRKGTPRRSRGKSTAKRASAPPRARAVAKTVRKRTAKRVAKRIARPTAARRKAAPRPAATRVRPAAAVAAAVHARIDQPVPDFTLPATGGATWQLQGARGKKLVLYFYPRDNTPGCTLEGQQFAALLPQFEQLGVEVYGISRDSLASHEKFRSQMCFPFALLSDADEAVCRLFDVIREKNMYGRKVLGIERSTFLIDGAGVLRREWRAVKVDGHARAVLEAAQSL